MQLELDLDYFEGIDENIQVSRQQFVADIQGEDENIVAVRCLQHMTFQELYTNGGGACAINACFGSIDANTGTVTHSWPRRFLAKDIPQDYHILSAKIRTTQQHILKSVISYV